MRNLSESLGSRRMIVVSRLPRSRNQGSDTARRESGAAANYNQRAHTAADELIDTSRHRDGANRLDARNSRKTRSAGSVSAVLGSSGLQFQEGAGLGALGAVRRIREG